MNAELTIENDSNDDPWIEAIAKQLEELRAKRAEYEAGLHTS